MAHYYRTPTKLRERIVFTCLSVRRGACRVSMVPGPFQEAGPISLREAGYPGGRGSRGFQGRVARRGYLPSPRE